MHKPLLVTEFLDRARDHDADEEAVVATTGARYTYAELGDRADRFSAALQERGVERGDRVAVLDPNTHYHLEAAYGSMQAGAVHTPLNYRLTPDDYEYILNDAGVTEDELVDFTREHLASYKVVRRVEFVEELPTTATGKVQKFELREEWADEDRMVGQG